MLKVLGTKKIMTQVFSESGEVIPVTIIDMNSLVMVKKVSDDRVLIGYGKSKHPTQDQVGCYKELGYVPSSVMEVDAGSMSGLNVGDTISVEVLKDVTTVDITGTTKGKGFAGVVKRWGFAGGPKRPTGQSDRHRAPGSIGSGTTPGRVYKGKKMAGRMGGDKVTIKNLKLVRIDEKNGYLLVKGAVPGSVNSVVTITVK